mgnify:CR=1 FL=1
MGRRLPRACVMLWSLAAAACGEGLTPTAPTAPPSVCKVSTTPRDIRLVVEQEGRLLAGVFSMNEPGGPTWPFVGYVTAGGAFAGIATIDGASRVVLRLTTEGWRLSGEVSDEGRTDGRLTFTRHFVVSTPLTRIGPTL